ncbi:MAG: DNA starvation/stationary phase protection protein [Roseitalea porphyridii]|jgi:starvation-inducible DNA-binding protein|uniref:DNA starvation/stationary phase protection protein n=1 Tax=Roseitalea porphyridii TaxID=1852022 RepID=A0A4P6V0H4_9HYPH|nr:DNA starvation/stationary phase protection protein [Roseitalea porphyridii]QBK29820.1 DNA starvation/stationary phase protection protein [Roseitalea porphyridii]
MSQAVLKPELTAENPSTGIDDESRRKIAEALSAVLTDTYYLVIKTHIYHWNVVGPLFHAVHEMTEEQYQNLFEAADEIAERIRALGHKAPIADSAGPGEAVVSTAASAKSAHDMIADLIADHEAAIRKMREAAEMAEEHRDLVTHDMLTARLTYHEQVVWMLRALATE